MSRNVVLVSHGKLAEGAQSAVEMVFGKSEELSSLGLSPDGNVVELIGGLRAQVEAEPQKQFVVLADIFGGSVCNQCLQQLSEFENVKLVAGLSMGLALSILSVPGELSDAQLEQAVADAREGTKIVELIRADAPVDSGEDDFFSKEGLPAAWMPVSRTKNRKEPIMITMARVDDRLIHGQVAVKWSKELNISRIIVASDSIAKNAVQVAALKGAAPAGVKAAILPIVKAQGILNDPRSRDMRILVVSNDPADILAVLKGIEERPVVNVANYGRINGPIGGKQKISDSVYLTDEDKTVLKEIDALGDEVIHQPLPESDRVNLMSLI